VILVEVSAAWCHWCHVMERTTYADPRVRAEIDAAFLPVKVDADARPDLAERWAEYHWPATAFLTPDAREVLALRGYRAPDVFLGDLARARQAVREGRTLVEAPPPSGGAGDGVPGRKALVTLRARLEGIVAATWDAEAAGWGFGQKYPFAAPLEHAWTEAALSGRDAWREMALRTLAAEEALIDPVWGGMYQYSEGGVWGRPHFEKVVAVQAGAISAYAAAYRGTRDPRWLRDAQAVRRFVSAWLRGPGGAFLTSMDADLGARDGGPAVDGAAYFARDDAGRRALGIPRIDRAAYAQENGRLVAAYADLFAASGDASALEEAKAAARRIFATHADGAGGLRHAEGDPGVLHLGDQASFGRALLALAEVTGEASWRDEAARVARSLLARFRAPGGGGFLATTEDATAAGDFRARQAPLEPNADAARFLLALEAATGDAAWREAALRAIGSAGAEGLAERFGPRAAALLLAVEEALFPRTRVTLVADAFDEKAERLWAAALALDVPFAWRERAKPGMASPAGGAAFPSSPVPALYATVGERRSAAVVDPGGLWAAAEGLRPR
jgi:uncharacterized protein YyaL (SSP411 family)